MLIVKLIDNFSYVKLRTKKLALCRIKKRDH